LTSTSESRFNQIQTAQPLGHHHVGKDKVDPILAGIPEFQGFPSVRRGVVVGRRAESAASRTPEDVRHNLKAPRASMLKSQDCY
jgi:hypothetical protein